MTFETYFTELPSDLFLQKILSYAGAILVGIESAGARKVSSNAKWFYVLQTTRVLIAHCTIMIDGQDMILRAIASNIRNLYLLFGMDLADTKAWRNVTDDVMYYMVPDSRGRIWVSLDTFNFITEVKSLPFDDIRNEFTIDTSLVKHLIGHCIFKLVATSFTPWETSMTRYRHLH